MSEERASDKCTRMIIERAFAEWSRRERPPPDVAIEMAKRQGLFIEGFVAGWIARSLEDGTK